MEAVKYIPLEINQEELLLTPVQRLQIMSDEIQKENEYNYKKYKEFLRRIRKGEKITAEEQVKQKESWDMIKNMEKCYTSLYKFYFPKAGKNQNINPTTNLVGVKEEKSTIGNIQREIPKI
jgi:hypothetical protein